MDVKSESELDSEWERELEFHAAKVTRSKSPSSVGSHSKIFACSVPGCQKFFSKSSRLKTHELVHTGERPFKCEVEDCDASYTRKVHLDRHVESKHNEKKASFMCGFCDGLFASQDSLKVHTRRVHESRKRYPCELCGKSFVKKSFLSKHMCVGMSEEEKKERSRPHKCEFCHKGFAFPNKLKIHKKSCSLGRAAVGKLKASPAITVKKGYHCDICDKMFTRADHKLVHANEKLMFHCPEEGCDGVYMRKRTLDHHIKAKHKENVTFPCTFDGCGKSLASKAKLDYHLHLHSVRGLDVKPASYDPKVGEERADRRDKGEPQKCMASALASFKVPQETNRVLLHEKTAASEKLSPQKLVKEMKENGINLDESSGAESENEITIGCKKPRTEVKDQLEMYHKLDGYRYKL